MLLFDAVVGVAPSFAKRSHQQVRIIITHFQNSCGCGILFRLNVVMIAESSEQRGLKLLGVGRRDRRGSTKSAKDSPEMPQYSSNQSWRSLRFFVPFASKNAK